MSDERIEQLHTERKWLMQNGNRLELIRKSKLSRIKDYEREIDKLVAEYRNDTETLKENTREYLDKGMELEKLTGLPPVQFEYNR